MCFVEQCAPVAWTSPARGRRRSGRQARDGRREAVSYTTSRHGPPRRWCRSSHPRRRDRWRGSRSGDRQRCGQRRACGGARRSGRSHRRRIPPTRMSRRRHRRARPKLRASAIRDGELRGWRLRRRPPPRFASLSNRVRSRSQPSPSGFSRKSVSTSSALPHTERVPNAVRWRSSDRISSPNAERMSFVMPGGRLSPAQCRDGALPGQHHRRPGRPVRGPQPAGRAASRREIRNDRNVAVDANPFHERAAVSVA